MSRHACDLLRALNQAGMRYYTIAGRAGVSRSLLSQLMHGKTVPKGDERLARIGKFLELPAEEWEEPA